MALNIPNSASDIVAAAKLDVQREIQASNPFLRNSFLGGIVTGISNRIWDFYYALSQVAKESLPDTAVEKLERWANIWGINRIAGTVASGQISAGGTGFPTIPIGTKFVSSDGSSYSATTSDTMSFDSAGITQLTGSGNTATVETTAPHNLASNLLVIIGSASHAPYNVGVTAIQVTDATHFTYTTLLTITVSPDVGSPAYISLHANVLIESDEVGADKNLDLNTKLTFQTPIAGFNTTVGVTFDGVGGGTDQETEAALRARLLERIRNPIAHFSSEEIIAKSKTIAGVTRVFVFEVTPAVGQVTIYFMRDNDLNPIPSGSEITNVYNVLVTILPANTSFSDLIVLAPTPIATAFTFSAIVPDTPTMRAAITANLEAFFAEIPTVSTDITQDSYRASIFNTVDITNGAAMTSFALSAPAGDITIASGQIGTLGAVIFP